MFIPKQPTCCSLSNTWIQLDSTGHSTFSISLISSVSEVFLQNLKNWRDVTKTKMQATLIPYWHQVSHTVHTALPADVRNGHEMTFSHDEAVPRETHYSTRGLPKTQCAKFPSCNRARTRSTGRCSNDNAGTANIGRHWKRHSKSRRRQCFKIYDVTRWQNALTKLR